RMTHCEHHYVFCLPRGSAPSLVVAIFHERMDLMTRLATRLSSES
ncbi:type II toxin-antitoxin system RelE/ParE family toxin, partial [Salmonella enterica]|nr:type II toxin-antitoxin system RelE/ParE family toxin [Salmonella enterica]